jgi:hypothetical protein
MALAETEVEVRSWLDRLAMQDLIYRYSDALTRSDWKQAEALYAPDAIWESPKQGLRYESAAASSRCWAAPRLLRYSFKLRMRQ